MSRMQILRKMFPTFSYTRHRVLMNARSSSTEIPSPTTAAESSKEVPSESSSVKSQHSKDEGEEFRYLLRHSSFVNMGDPNGKIVRGKIFHVVDDDLYIDFGWKFHCVCSKPVKGGEHYVRGAEVLLEVKNLELSSKFLGAKKGLTLLEADASIIKLLSTPCKQNS